ncbi:MAG: hypothetical protein PHR83_12775 [Paludibacter sp.]|nr:hypothetical protein [Paludibacter sp.]
MKQFFSNGWNIRCRYGMPALCSLVLVVLLTVLSPPKALAQANNVLVYSDSLGTFLPNKELPPYGEKLIIRGTVPGQIEYINVTAVYGLVTQKVKADISGHTWSAIVGPFPVKSNVTFIIDQERKLTDAEIEQLVDTLVETVNSASRQFMVNDKAMYQDDFKKLVSTRVFNNRKLDSYATNNNHPLDSILWNEFEQTIFKGNFAKRVSDLKALNDIKAQKFYRLIEKYKTSPGCAKFIRQLDEGDELSSKDTTVLFADLKHDKTFEYSELSVQYKFLLDVYTPYREAKKELKGIIENIRAKGTEILKKQMIVLSTSTSMEILGIESYIGFDLGAMYIPKLSNTRFFVTLSPYLRKIEPDKDYRIDFNHVGTLLYFFTPTLGYGIGNKEADISPIYFVGLGCRLNKIVRIAVGGNYYTPTNATTYEWSWGVNASINTNYISDFVRSITSVQANIPK